MPARALGRRIRRQVPSALGSADLFYEITTPPPDLVIFGAGHDVGARRAAGLDARVRGDRRRCPRSVPDDGAVSAARRWCARISASSPSSVRSAPGSFALVMNHHVERDQESLRFASNPMRPTSACSGPGHATTSCWPAWRSQGLRAGPGEGRRACEARWGSRWGRRRRKKWRCPSWASSSRFDAASTAGSSAARSAAFTAPKTSGSWPARSLRACRYPPADPAETAGPGSARGAAAARERAPCWSWASSGKNSRSNRCGGAMTSPYRTLTMAGACWR